MTAPSSATSAPRLSLIRRSSHRDEFSSSPPASTRDGRSVCHRPHLSPHVIGVPHGYDTGAVSYGYETGSDRGAALAHPVPERASMGRFMWKDVRPAVRESVGIKFVVRCQD